MLDMMTFMGLVLSPLGLPTLHAWQIRPCQSNLSFKNSKYGPLNDLGATFDCIRTLNSVEGAIWGVYAQWWHIKESLSYYINDPRTEIEHVLGVDFTFDI
jgi:hypothetical protein